MKDTITVATLYEMAAASLVIFTRETLLATTSVSPQLESFAFGQCLQRSG
jgi:hypothetical protein